MMEVNVWSLDKIVPYARNARKIPAQAVDKVAASIKEFGWRQPIVVDREGVIIVGHVRLLAAQKLGLTEAPVHIASNLTPPQVRAYRLLDNRSHEETQWDDDLLGLELLDLRDLGFDLDLTGFDPTEIDDFLLSGNDEKAETAPPLPETPISRAGDLWLLGNHRLLCGDSTDGRSVTTLLGTAKPLLMVTDPPYGIELDSEWRDRAGINKRGRAEPSYMKQRSEGHTQTSISGDTIADWSHAFELVPSLAIAYVWHASRFTSEVLAGLLRIGFLHHQQIIWRKSAAALTRTHYWFQHEPCWYVRKKNAPWYGKPGETTVWEAASPKMIMGGSSEEKFDHPTQKPLELMRRPILNHTKLKSVVYDPFLGSGTTLMASEVTGRICYGIDIDPGYVDVAVQRWQKFTGHLAHLEADGRSFDEVTLERAGRNRAEVTTARG
jgi:DNA modification methylase